MTRLSELLLRFLEGPGPALILALAWTTLAVAARRAPSLDLGAAAVRRGSPDARLLALLAVTGAAQLLTGLVLRLPGLTHWQAPTDRLYGGLFVFAVAAASRPWAWPRPATWSWAKPLESLRSRDRSGRAAARTPPLNPLVVATRAGSPVTLQRWAAADGVDARWRVVLAAAGLALVAWIAAAPGWAAAVRAGAASATSLSVLADVVLAGGTLLLAAAIGSRRPARCAAPTSGGTMASASTAPRLSIAMLGALALFSALQALWPTPGAAVVWRCGVLAAGAGSVVAAARRGAGRDGRLARRLAATIASSWSGTGARVSAARSAVAGTTTTVLDAARRRAGGAWRAIRGAAVRRGDGAVRRRPGGSARARLALASTVGEALGGALRQLDAAVVYAGLIEDEAVRFWALTPTGALQELYRRPLGQLAAVKRALQSGAGALGSRTEARDIDDLYGHLGLPYDGPVLLAAGGRPARAVLIAGSAYGPWRHDDPNRLAAYAAALAARLSSLDEPAASPAPVEPAATVDDVARLRAEVAALHADMARFGTRLDGLERRFEGQPALGDRLAGAAQLVPSPAASYLVRLEAYQRLLEPLPWGVVVCDPDGRVILANSAARRLLVGAALLPGHRIDVPGPGARTLVRSLRDAASTLQGGRMSLAAMDTVVRIEPIDRPNWRQRNRLGATLVVTTAADAATGGEAILVDLLDALRDPLVDLRLQGESLDAEVRMPMPDLMRHLAVLDGHAAGLRAVLGALAAQRSLAMHDHRPERGAVDIGDLGATTERSLRDLFALRGIRFRGVRGIVPSDVTVDVRLLEHVALAIVTGAVSTASWGSHLSVHVRHEAIVQGDPASAIVVVIDMLDGGLTTMTQRRPLDEAALAAHPAALRVGHALAERGFPGCEAWFARRTPEDQRLQLCLRLPVGKAA